MKRAKLSIPANPKREQHEKIKLERRQKKKPQKVTIEDIYEQNEQILDNQEYLIELMRKQR